MRHVLFSLGDERFAVPLSAVREVVPAPPSYTRVPRTSEVVKGVMNLRGRVVTVLDTAHALGVGSLQAGSQVLLLDQHQASVGLLVSQVDGIAPLSGTSPVATRGPAVRAVAQGPEGAVVAVVDVEGLDAQVARTMVRR